MVVGRYVGVGGTRTVNMIFGPDQGLIANRKGFEHLSGFVIAGSLQPQSPEMPNCTKPLVDRNRCDKVEIVPYLIASSSGHQAELPPIFAEAPSTPSLVL